MIELRDEALKFSFPEVHPDARFSIDFQRTLRIPDDGRDYPLPAGLGRFPLRHVDDYAAAIPGPWSRHGGVMLPMYQSEALWVDFSSSGYPFAVKIAAGKVNAVTGGPWDTRLHHGPSPSGSARPGRSGAEQDYVVLPQQPWLDGFNVGSGRIRQFVAMPLGQGYTAEEQITGRADVGGLQILAYPIKAEFYRPRPRVHRMSDAAPMATAAAAPPDMGLGLGGLMRQDISADPHPPEAWDLRHPARCFVHLTNSAQWAAITGHAPPMRPITAAEYQRAGIPWFSYYATGEVLPGDPRLADLDSVQHLAHERGQDLHDDDPIPIDRITHLARPAGEAVREMDEG